MNEKDYIQSKAELSSLKKTYSDTELKTSNPFKRFFLRAGRKMTFWYINPFGDSQNQFNKTVVKSFDDTSNSLEDLNNKIQMLETKLSSVVQQNDALKTRINKLQQNDIAIVDTCLGAIENTQRESNKYIDNYIRQVNPDKRKKASFSDCREISDLQYLDLTNSIISKPLEQLDLDTWGKTYKDTLQKQLRSIAVSSTRSIIAVVCKGFLMSQGIEAVRNEAFALYHLLKKSSTYNIKFVSIEPTLERPVFVEDIFCIPEKGAGQYLQAINPILCVFCESTLSIGKLDNCSMILNKAIFKLSGQNPLQNISQSTIDEFTHLNDFGLHKYLVQSKNAYDVMVKNGFHEPVISYPLINKGKIYPRKRVYNKNNFTIGFATSPMGENQVQHRGVNLLCELVKALPNVKFEILWRYDTAKLPEDLSNANNCVIHNGMYDMKTFYSSIDSVIIPYQTTECNHACSLSGIEAMQNGIPVLCTDVSGISEVVKFCGMGEVVPPNCDDMVKAINNMIENYQIYVTPTNKQRLDTKIDNTNLVDIIEKFAEDVLPSKPVTLYEWDRRLKTTGKYLVKGHQKMKEYYQQQSVADKYTEDRFTSKALKCFDFIERQNIDLIIEDRFENMKPKFLDIACGDGRISQECIKYGETLSIDSSEAMLNIVNDRFKSNENKPTTKICDIIAEDLDGKFNVITCFRYIRHFEYSTRKELYKKISSHLADTGILIMDIPNLKFELQLKNTSGWEKYNIYDVFWTKESIIEELENNGLKVQYILPVGQGLMDNVPNNAKNIPMSWTIGAVKKF